MKYLFAIIAATLVAASIGTSMMLPDRRDDVPVLYWVTDPNPARFTQIEVFSEWLRKNNYPKIDMRVDAANKEIAKRIIQGVSGVAGEIFDIYNGGEMRTLHALGILTDVTDLARERGFDPSKTYPAMLPDITVDGRQFTFPANVWTAMFWVNKATFRKHGLPIPPSIWDFEAFERLGKQFVEVANPPGEPRRNFFANHVEPVIIRRSMGLSTFNETLTRCTLDDPRNVRTLELIYKWTYQDHLLPTRSESTSFATDSGFGGSVPQLFKSGNYAIVQYGRYILIQLRQFGSMELSVSELPNGGFRNTITGTRAASVYIDGKRKDLAPYFLEFLASEDYNMQIVRDCDAMPPNPAYTQLEEFLYPPQYPNEWECHQAYADALRDIAISLSYSPFVLPGIESRIRRQTHELFMADQLSAQEAAQRMADLINEEVQRTLNDKSELQRRYDQLCARQLQIDELRASDKKVPLDWIENPFYRRYYQAQGWAE